MSNIIEVGGVYKQHCGNTVFKHKVLKYIGVLKTRQYLVENVETGFRHVLSEEDLINN